MGVHAIRTGERRQGGKRQRRTAGPKNSLRKALAGGYDDARACVVQPEMLGMLKRLCMLALIALLLPALACGCGST
jgi:hypothetical protein